MRVLLSPSNPVSRYFCGACEQSLTNFRPKLPSVFEFKASVCQMPPECRRMVFVAEGPETIACGGARPVFGSLWRRRGDDSPGIERVELKRILRGGGFWT